MRTHDIEMRTNGTRVLRRPVREGGGLVGTLFAPASSGPRPAVVVLGGSEGGLLGQGAATTTIPVEKIGGPMLLVSGTDDQVWPTTPLSEIAMERLGPTSTPSPASTSATGARDT
jgi:hypothetical protein